MAADAFLYFFFLLLKDHAKASLSGEGGLPRDVARVLYFCAIQAARKLLNGEISSLDDASIRREIRVPSRSVWVTEVKRLR